MGRFLFTSFCLISLLLSKEPHLLSVASGVFDVKHKKHRALKLQVEFRPNVIAYTFRPTVGAFITSKASFYLYGGFGFEWIYHDFIVSPNFAMGWYLKGKGKDLGFPIEFRSGIELGRRLKNSARVGLQFYHISNARRFFHWSNRNPGSESLVLFYSIPI